MRKVAILQSNYIPWKGYFDLIAHVDEFIIFDEVQYTKNDWRNRNLIKTPSGPSWLTIPVSQGLDQTINQVVATDNRWRIKHWKTLEANFRRAACFGAVFEILRPIYLERDEKRLSEINRSFIDVICDFLNIKTAITSAGDYHLEIGKTERLVSLCVQAGATCYVSGPAAKSYLDVSQFQEKQIEVEWFDYAGYPEYPQLWGEFSHTVSILDLMFNCGTESAKFMKHVGS